MITIDTTPDKIGQALQGVLDGIGRDFVQLSYVDVLNDTHKQLESEERAMFASETDPSGASWKPLAQATIDRKGHAIILFEGGHLKGSLAARNEYSIRETIVEGRNQGLVFGTARPFAGVHQYGSQRVPARPHVGVSLAWIGKFAKRVAEAAVKKLIERRK